MDSRQRAGGTLRPRVNRHVAFTTTQDSSNHQTHSTFQQGRGGAVERQVNASLSLEPKWQRYANMNSQSENFSNKS